jgi:hypothetical protein
MSFFDGYTTTCGPCGAAFGIKASIISRVINNKKNINNAHNFISFYNENIDMFYDESDFTHAKKSK